MELTNIKHPLLTNVNSLQIKGIATVFSYVLHARTQASAYRVNKVIHNLNNGRTACWNPILQNVHFVSVGGIK